MIPDDDLEARLHRVHPPEPPWELVLRLRAAEPSLPAGLTGPWLTLSWRWAYAGVFAAWTLVAVLRLLTAPLLPPGAADAPVHAQSALSSSAVHPTSAEWNILFAYNRNSDPLWP